MAVKADATLVSAAFKLGESNVPHDTSQMFKEQFEALEEMNIAKMDMFGDIGEAAVVVAEKIDQNKQFMEGRDNLVKDFKTNIAEYDRQRDERGGGPDEDTIAAQQKMLEEVKEQIETLRDAPGVRTPEQTKQLRQLEKSVLAWRDENNKEMTRLKVNSYNLATDNVDHKQSFETEIDFLTGKEKGEPGFLTGKKVIDHNKSMLHTQVSSSAIRLSDAGITVGRNEKGERGYYYNDRIDRVKQQAEILAGTYVPNPSLNNAFITADELFGGVVLKDKSLQTDAIGIMGESAGLATAADYAIEIDPITGNKTKSKNKKLLYKDYDSAAPGQEEKIYNRIMATHEAGKDGELGEKRDVKAGIRYMSNNDILLGDNKFNYGEDSLKNPAITTLSYSKLGLSGSVDENNDGTITGDELSDADKKIVHNRLMNPETAAEVEISARELAKYLDMQARDQFNKTRKQAEMMGPRPKSTSQRKSGSGKEKNVYFDMKTSQEKFLTEVVEDPETGEKRIERKTDDDGNVVGAPKFTKVSTNPTQLRNKANQLFSMQRSGVSSFDTDDIVDLYGISIGYFPGKGFAPVRINEDGQVVRQQFKGTKTPTHPTLGGGYMKTPEAVFERYSIPVEYSNTKKKLR